MKKTRILLSCSGNPQNYVNAIERLGASATACYLPPVDTDYDGLLLCGGADIHPARYHEPIDGSVGIDLARDEAEFALMRAYMEVGKPIFGICRGHQLINVFFGGSLHQDMADAALHTRKNDADAVHAVTAQANSIVGKLYGTTFFVNSSHHQSVKQLGTGLRATAVWQGSSVEAIEHETYPIFGVQWHPERMCFDNQRADTVCGADILAYFISLCDARKKA